ncbi:MAG TPA: hypothetical protein VNN12_00930 [Dehalococcoidia bacterium]|jgi:hypothetical protein|nr:hypothetical protein [Dehalococcoidia bacterium]
MVPHSVSRRIAAAATVLLALVIVNVLALDHTVSRLSADLHEHVQHCHGEPASCANQPIPSGPGQFLFAEPGAPAPDLPAIDVPAGPVPPADGREPAPQPHPPRA